MGQLHSRVVAGSTYATNLQRLSVRELQCYLNEGDQTCSGTSVKPVSPTSLLTVSQDGITEGNATLRAQKTDQKPLTFVLDPETKEMMLQLPYQPSLTLKFALDVAIMPSDQSTRLVFAHAGSAAELQFVISHRQTEMWIDVREWAESNQVKNDTLEFLFVWDAQTDRFGGQPIHFAFFIDDGNEWVGAGGAVWVSERANDNELLYDPTQFISSPTENPPGTLPYSVTPHPAHPQSTIVPVSTKQTPPKTAPPVVSQPQGVGAVGQTPGSTTAGAGADVMMPYSVPLGPHKDSSRFQAPRPTVDHQFQAEDGPQFRSAIASMERRVPMLKTRIKQLLKRSMMSRERLQALIEADTWLASGIQEASRQDCASFRPIVDWFSRNSEGGLSAIQRQRKVSLNELNTRIIEPLKQFYDYDIKCFEQKKRDFEEESSQFYSWTSRYLSARKEARRSKVSESSDHKFAIKKRAFDAARFEYFSYLSDLTTGLKQQVLLQLLALAAQSLTDSHIALGSELANRTQPRIDHVVEDIKRAAREWEKYRLDKLNYRKAFQEETDNNTSGSYSNTSASSSGPNAVDISGVAAAATTTDDKQGSPEPGVHSTSFVDPATTTNYKEGLLWASNRPGGIQDSQGTNKQPTLQNLKWHKFWVVLDGTSLREYSNWKQSVDLHNEPINLLVASVRQARNSDRRFCFEVVTPQYKRIYQATSEDDMRSWIAAIHKSIATLLESTDDPQLATTTPSSQQYSQHQSHYGHHHHHRDNDLEVSKQRSLANEPTSPRTNGERIESLTRKLSLKNDKPRVPPIITSISASNQQPIFSSPKIITTHQPLHYEPNKNSNDAAVAGGSSSGGAPASASGGASSPFEELIYQIQCISSNRYCAECHSTKSVEWVSINLLMVLCIECSGAHRSLGSHISKVRSLTLDTGAFTPSLKAALLAVSNEMMNKIWEAKISPERKLLPDSSSQARIKFVSEKYVEKQFIIELDKPNTALRRAISEQDIPKVCAALASRANPNGVSDEDEPMLIHALRSAAPQALTFPLAEVLIKNGANVPPLGVYEGLSAAAEQFLTMKQLQP